MKEIKVTRATITGVEVKVTYATGGTDTHTSPQFVQMVPQVSAIAVSGGPQKPQLITILDEESLGETIMFMEAMVADLKHFAATGSCVDEQQGESNAHPD